MRNWRQKTWDLRTPFRIPASMISAGWHKQKSANQAKYVQLYSNGYMKRYRLDYHTDELGKTVYTAIIEKQIMPGVWVTICTKQDHCLWYVQARAEEALYYLDDE